MASVSKVYKIAIASQNGCGWKGPMEVILYYLLSSSRASQSLLPRTVSRWLSSISKDGEATTSLGKLCQSSATFTVKRVFPDVQRKPPSCVSVCASYLVTEHLGKEPGSIFLTPSVQVFTDIDNITPEPSVLQTGQSQLSQPFLNGEMLQSCNHLSGPLLDSLQYVRVSLVLESPELDTVLQGWPHQCC